VDLKKRVQKMVQDTGNAGLFEILKLEIELHKAKFPGPSNRESYQPTKAKKPRLVTIEHAAHKTKH
jgi:hypothetical protein